MDIISQIRRAEIKVSSGSWSRYIQPPDEHTKCNEHSASIFKIQFHMTSTWHNNMNASVLNHKICAPVSWSTSVTKPRTTEAQVTCSFRITFISISISVSSRLNSPGCLKNTMNLFKRKAKSYTEVMLIEKTLCTNLCQPKILDFPKSTMPRYTNRKNTL